MAEELFEHIPQRLKPLFEATGKPWDPLNRLSDFVRRELEPSNEGILQEGVYLDREVEIGEGTIIEHGAIIRGPAIIGRGCVIRAHTYIRGEVVVGDNCTIGHSTEIVRSILLDGVRVDHFNYVGDSILGNEVHFGAGAKVANLRFDDRTIRIDEEDTNRQKLGAILGDGCQLGVNVAIGPGVILEPDIWLAGINLLKSGTYDQKIIKNLLRQIN